MHSEKEKCTRHAAEPESRIRRELLSAPGGGSRGVAEAVEGVLGWLALGGCKGQLLLHFVNDSAATRVQQEVLEGLVELGHVCLVHDHLDLHQ